MSTRPSSISLCMIVKDEEANLARCLKSVRGLVDETIVVDTGSSDGTIALARSHGATVLHEDWCDDYSAPRNASLAATTGEWILVLDADEALSLTDHATIRRAVERADVDGYRMRTRNYVRDLSIADAVRNVEPPQEGAGYPAWIPSDKVRLFRNNPRVRFRGAIHELVDASLREIGGRIEFLDVPVHHYGFLIEGEARARKTAMQRRIADRKLGEAPDDFKAHYEWAVIAHTQGDFAAARDALARSIDLKPDWATSHYERGYVCERLEDYAAAIEHYRRALALDPRHLSAGINLGVLAIRAGLLVEAERVLRQTTQHHPAEPRAWNNLGVALVRSGRAGEAETVWRTALRLDSTNPEAQENLARLGRTNEPEASPNPRVSLCMIVRDEGANLRAAVEPIRDLMDELVIVDTGSQDKTVEIAESLGARVVRFDWRDGFAAARNAGLAEATGDWIVWLDADDRVPDSSRAALAEALRRRPDHAVQWCIESQSGGREPVRFLQLRQFPRRDGIRWRGRIHESVLRDIRAAGLEVRNADGVVVVHTGYRDAETLRAKHERNRRLLELEHGERPDDATVCHHLSQMYALLGREADAERVAKHILALEPLEGDERYLGLQARIRLAQLAVNADRPDTAQAWLRKALEIVPHYPPAEYLLGELCWKAGQETTAVAHLRNVVRADMPLSEIPLPLHAIRAGAWNVLGRIAQAHGDHATAVTCFDNALAQAPNVDVIQANKARSVAELQSTSMGSAEDARPLLSLCMIVRDEEWNLRALLPHVAPIVDELVVVDTGSEDGSMAVCAAHGARVLTQSWADDFADARNAGLDVVTGRWVLWLDADDRMDPRALGALRDTLATLEQQAIRLPVRSRLPEGQTTTLSLRVFPADRGIRWVGRVHEDLVASCEAAGVPIIDCFDVEIEHLGYAEAAALRDKMWRNRALLERQVAEQPRDARAQVHLAEVERFFGETAAARARLDTLLAGPLSVAVRAHALARRADLARACGELSRRLECAHEWIRLTPNDALARMCLAEALMDAEQWDEGCAVLDDVAPAEIRPNDTPADLAALRERWTELRRICRERLAGPTHRGVVDAAFVQANALWERQDLREADAAYARVLHEAPGHGAAMVQRGNIAFARGDYLAAEEWYLSALAAEPNLRPAKENAALVALAQGKKALARTRLEAALAKYPDAHELRVHLADIDFGEARYGQALNGYRQYLTAHPSDVKAVVRLGECLRLLGHRTEARRAYAAALGLDPGNAAATRGLAVLGASV